MNNYINSIVIEFERRTTDKEVRKITDYCWMMAMMFASPGTAELHYRGFLFFYWRIYIIKTTNSTACCVWVTIIFRGIWHILGTVHWRFYIQTMDTLYKNCTLYFNFSTERILKIYFEPCFVLELCCHSNVTNMETTQQKNVYRLKSKSGFSTNCNWKRWL